MRLLLPALLAYRATAETATEQSSHIQHQANDSLATIHGSNDTISVKGSAITPGIVILDYGGDVEGYPTFEVVSAAGDTSSLEITYSESKAVLDGYYMVKINLRFLDVNANPSPRATDHLLWPRPWTPTESIGITSPDHQCTQTV